MPDKGPCLPRADSNPSRTTESEIGYGVAMRSVPKIADQALRMEKHPGVFFRNGQSGRRAVLIGGPDVWEVVRAVKSAQAAEPDLASDAVVRLAGETMGLPPDRVRVALDYWEAYSDEIGQQIRDAEEAELVARSRMAHE
jgi:hypothetical protein